MSKHIQIQSIATGEIIRDLDVSDRSDREIDKILDGITEKIDYERFDVNLVEIETVSA